MTEAPSATAARPSRTGGAHASAARADGSVTPKRPRIPAELYRPRPLLATAMIATALVLFFGGGALAWKIGTMDGPLWLRTPGLLIALLAAAHGGHLLGFVGHEGIHLILHPNRYVSMTLGSFFSAATSFSAVGYGVSHWNHHRFTNLAADPDAQIYSEFETFWRRFFFARGAGSRSHVRNTLRLARGESLEVGYRLPFSARAQRRFARLNVAFHAFWFGLYAVLLVLSPAYAIFAVLLPILVLIPISGLRGYIEHAGTGIGMFRDTRSFASPIYTALFFGNNLHLEHHLYPAVPCYNLVAVNRLLDEGGHFGAWEAQLDRSLLGPLRHTSAASQYPCFDAAADLDDAATAPILDPDVRQSA
jgi:beta-carotene hydroxylase